MPRLRCSPLLHKVVREINIKRKVGSFKGIKREVEFPVTDKLEKIVYEEDIQWVINFQWKTATLKGERNHIKGECTKYCHHWKECCKELGLKKEPRGFKEVPANKWAIMFKEYHLDYADRPVIWKMK
jgi:hypothetical protein